MPETCPNCPGHLPSLCGDGVNPCAQGLELAEKARQEERERWLQAIEHGCGDGSCIMRKPEGAHTNGGCECLKAMRFEERRRLLRAMNRIRADKIKLANELNNAKWKELADALAREPIFRSGRPDYARGYHSAIASVQARLKMMGVL